MSLSQKDDTARQARDLGKISGSRLLSNALGNRDQKDFYKFSLLKRSNLSIQLTGLKANADLSILSSNGKVLGQSRKSGKASESLIGTDIAAGTYYVKVAAHSRRDKTSYRLKLSVTLSNEDDPNDNEQPIVRNSTLSLGKGAVVIIDSNQLQATDSLQSPKELIYTLTSLPQQGILRRKESDLVVGSKFTQADINQGLLTYRSLPTSVQLTDSTPGFVSIDGDTILFDGKVSGGTTELFSYKISAGRITQLTSSL
jgi:Cadherin-like/Bacterial pre-peptidase C-terminal domain